MKVDEANDDGHSDGGEAGWGGGYASEPFGDNRKQSSLPAQGAPKTVKKTKDGKAICQAYNAGHCKGKCPKWELHICNAKLRNGRACGLRGHASKFCKNKRRAP